MYILHNRKSFKSGNPVKNVLPSLPTLPTLLQKGMLNNFSVCCINIRSLKALNREESHKKLRSILANSLSIAILTESHLTTHKWEVF